MKGLIFSNTVIGLVVGGIGGLLLNYLMTDPFELHYFGGYLLLLVMLVVIFVATGIYIIFGNGTKKYWSKVYAGFLAFFVMIIISRINQLMNESQAWEFDKSDIIGTTFFLLIIGFCFSLLFACIKSSEYRNVD